MFACSVYGIWPLSTIAALQVRKVTHSAFQRQSSGRLGPDRPHSAKQTSFTTSGCESASPGLFVVIVGAMLDDFVEIRH